MSLPTIVVNYLVEDFTSEVVSFSPARVIWLAHNKDAAIIATAFLLAQGYKAEFCHVPNQYTNAWHVQATF